ncbi:MAG: tRNA lysidine(34) synthetase TilS [Bacteroides sp.]|nr:tRNA lysidine(34) synthetase TilS [Roseburia sp.]MCM1462352.1 tRNA lysidine(34) synthetase TilS [Bacteroides sp.]
MENKAFETIRRYRMIGDGERVLVAVSGGADSMALLHLLYTNSEKMNISVYACHVDHHLRGAESDRDAGFVRDYCQKSAIPLTVFDADIPAAKKKHESVEECARRERYRFFGELSERLSAQVATAHTASDNAETVLLNLLRGTGTKGLGGIPPVRGNIIRPLLRCTRDETERYCQKNKIKYVTDSTNLSDLYTRNRLRQRVIPLLTEFNPSLIDGIARMTEAVYDDNLFLEQEADAARLRCRSGDGYDCSRLAALPPALFSRVVSALLRESGIEPSHLGIEGCMEIVRAGRGKINLRRDRFAVVKKGVFVIVTEKQNYRNLST